MAIFCNFHKA